MSQLEEVHVPVRRGPCPSMKRSMSQYEEVHVPVRRGPCPPSCLRLRNRRNHRLHRNPHLRRNHRLLRRNLVETGLVVLICV